jgi:hypothetical protein
MITLRLRIVFLLSLFLLAGANAFAQTSAEPTRLAVQIRYHDPQGPTSAYRLASAHIVVEPTEKHWIWFGRFSRVAGWTQPPNSQPLKAVKINAQQAEDGVRVWVSVLLGKVLEDEKQVSSYLLREGDTISAKELTGVGVVPFEFKVVRLAASASYVPEFKSKSPSIELASIQPNFAALPKVQLVLRNVSSKPVDAVEVVTVSDGIACLMTMRQGEEGQALIPPGGTFEMSVSLKTKYQAGANEYSIQTPPNQLIQVATAVFADGSYEGDSVYAMTFLGYQKGRKAQLERVIDLLQKAANGTADAASLKDKLSALNVDADPAAVEELDKQFPQPKQIEPARTANQAGMRGTTIQVGPRAKGDARTAIEVGMRAMRDDVLKDLVQFEIHNRYSDANAFNSWLASATQRYKAWRSRL